MTTKIEALDKLQMKNDLADIRSGDTVRVHQKISASVSSKTGKQGTDRIQTFEGLVIARKHGKGISSTITVRKIVAGVGVEKIFPIHSPIIEKIEIAKRGKTRRAKLYYLREAKGRKARLKKKEIKESRRDSVETAEITEKAGEEETGKENEIT